MTMTRDEEVQRKDSTAISKGAGMIEETRRLFEHWRPGEPLDDFTRRLQTEGLLANSTAYRTRDVVRRVFAPRFPQPSDKPARILQNVLGQDCRGVFSRNCFSCLRRVGIPWSTTLRYVNTGRPSAGEEP